VIRIWLCFSAFADPADSPDIFGSKPVIVDFDDDRVWVDRKLDKRLYAKSLRPGVIAGIRISDQFQEEPSSATVKILGQSKKFSKKYLEDSVSNHTIEQMLPVQSGDVQWHPMLLDVIARVLSD
jgi:hypothetical protein